ncbi:hypothetical protein V8G54_027116 [Vigna mungo]|uniref:F-box domain-containing protein n=1 Tax=Vigna mungo TaxID=3915 RepID=A0AAQ3N1L6_VIGMU
MADLISSLPNEIICYILYFLPFQQVVATSVLSKRWTHLWRSVPSLDFDTNKEDFYKNDYDKRRYYRWVRSFLVRRGDQPLYRFRLRCYHHMDSASIDQSLTFKSWIETTLSENSRVQIIDLFCYWENIVIPSVVFSFNTLVVLKLTFTRVEDISFVDLSFLKILHLEHTIFPIEDDPSQILSGCPNLEDLKVRALTSKVKGKFIRLPKLVRAMIDNLLLSLETFKEVEVLIFDWSFGLQLSGVLYVNFDFHNLVQLEFNVYADWHLVFNVLNHCPKLQSFGMSKYKNHYEDEDVWPYPQTTMKFWILEQEIEINDMERELSSSVKKSVTCTLSFQPANGLHFFT